VHTHTHPTDYFIRPTTAMQLALQFTWVVCAITERRVLELIPVLGSQPAGDVSHTPGCRLPLLSARPAVTLTTLKRAATNFAAW